MQMQAQRQRFALVWHGLNSAANNTVSTGVEPSNSRDEFCVPGDGKLDPESRANSERLTWAADVEGTRLAPAARAEAAAGELKRLDGTVSCS